MEMLRFSLSAAVAAVLLSVQDFNWSRFWLELIFLGRIGGTNIVLQFEHVLLLALYGFSLIFVYEHWVSRAARQRRERRFELEIISL